MILKKDNEEPLPIFEVLPQVREKLKLHNTLVLQAPPGAGKSTILPIQLINESWLSGKKILMLEPRRLAAKTVANRMAELLGEKSGNRVGYRIRFENVIGKSTRIEVVTEGILTRMLQANNSLEEYGLLIFDEFHERSLNSDLAFVLSREVQDILRPDLRILIMSATLDTLHLSSLLKAPIVTSGGRQFPIQIKYLPQEPGLSITVQVVSAIKKALATEEGDILAFLPGAGEIERAAESLVQSFSNISIHQLYGELPQQKQQEALLPDPEGRRKVVLATSIAETSLTIEGIKVVVDCGYSRVPKFNTRSGLTKLETIKVTKDVADQRAGRAGRLGPGVCYRLWSEASHFHLGAQRLPEILEADLAPLMLELAKWSKENIDQFNWITPPPPGAVKQAVELLSQLKALKDGKITEKGTELLNLPTYPRIAHMLLEAEGEGLIGLATDIAAILEERDPLPREQGVNLALRIEVLRKWRIKENVNADRNILQRIERLASSWRKSFNIEPDNKLIVDEQVGKLLSYAYPERVARQQGSSHRYRLANGKTVKINDNDTIIHYKWIVAAHLDAGVSEGKVFLAAPVDPTDILHLAEARSIVNWDYQKGVLIANKELRIGEITVERSPLDTIDPNLKISLLCEVLKKEGEQILSWTDEVKEWQSRLLSVKKWRPEEIWPDVSRNYLINNPEKWLSSYLLNIKKQEDFKKLDLLNILKSTIDWQQNQRLEELAPAKIKVPSGSEINLIYKEDGSSPVLAVRLQEVFGLVDTPTVNEGRTKVLLHLLSPGYKPVQVTQDLKSFWKNTYPEVRKELRIRYQKHSWPEDPWTAEAVRGVKRKLNQ